MYFIHCGTCCYVVHVLITYFGVQIFVRMYVISAAIVLQSRIIHFTIDAGLLLLHNFSILCGVG